MAKLQEEIIALRTQHDEQSVSLQAHHVLLTEAQGKRDEISRQYQEMVENREAVSQLHQQFEKEVFDLEKNIAVLLNNADIIRNENKILADDTHKFEEESTTLHQQLKTEGERKEKAAAELATLEEQELAKRS